MKNIILTIVLGLFGVGCELSSFGPEYDQPGCFQLEPGDGSGGQVCESQWECVGPDVLDNYNTTYYTEDACNSWCVEDTDCVCFGDICDL